MAPAAERQWLVGRCWVDGSSWCAVLVCCASLITHYYSCCLRVWNSVQPPHPHDPVSVPTATAGVDSGHSATDPISGGTSSGFGSRAVVVVMVTARVCVCMCVCVRARVRACACLCPNSKSTVVVVVVTTTQVNRQRAKFRRTANALLFSPNLHRDGGAVAGGSPWRRRPRWQQRPRCAQP